ncbi:Pr6Pr family membrane protein [Pseudooctadecabacter jejudonensis]|uniref:Pr6Pr family membrane protein n=1 Tax=Pseudooctadecabacter jejudonensis TaxID=1391910 RepID=UPI00117A4D4B|nr:Pr6Pr family membrane protein [Pseudooctadecabacter jejudonensis]
MTKARLAAGAIAVAVAVTLAVRLTMTAQQNETSFWGAVWIDYRFFTIWTNTLVGGVTAAFAMGRRLPDWATAGAAVSIGLVGSVYHTLLAAGRNLTGLDFVIDHMVHTVVPLGFIALWLWALPKTGLRWRHLAVWSAYPILYSVYAIARGAADGVYPYFFLNVPELGAAAVAGWVAGLAAVFLVAGAAMILGSRMAAR